ncbi:putative acetyltransferase [Gordonia effusa NBRC 100432]|uniref:Putative acetyltransferase n=1 Tax=Gordonia effusa NBRC 100432 TaxID=1077974 RepID=H0QV23_9ACTN|nr:GNAT family N-acetyltransferase [Gordonia effusa]GAB16674.1 putative acetyltransferase [Gordonia effusa NBRC 100432]
MLGDDDRRAIRALMDLAFPDDFDDDDFDHALGGIHAIVRSAGTVVGHASVVQRSVLIDDRPLRCGYVEAVAVHADWGRRGLGGALMASMESVIIGAYDLGALGASEQGRGLYRRRGWRDWAGELGVLTPDGYRPTPEDVGSVMVWGGDDLDISRRLACDWRAGDVW